VAVGITMFSDSAVNANRDAMVNDLVNLASRAQQFYRRPSSLGEVGIRFNGLTADATGIGKLTNKPVTATVPIISRLQVRALGTASIVELEGLGNETGTKRHERRAGPYQSVSQHRQRLDVELTCS